MTKRLTAVLPCPQIIDVPEGYSCDEGFEMYTTPVYSEWTLRIKKD